MGAITTLYPVTDENTIALTFVLTSLASSSTLLAGRESTAVDNTTNKDLDHVVSGKVRVGTTPTVDKRIAVWAYAPIIIASGTPEYPDVLDGADSDETITSEKVRNSMLRCLWVTEVDATTDRDYFMPPISIAQAFGYMPEYWGLFLAHDTAVALNATAANHKFHYHRIQASVA